jgi:glucosamine 6-phosphate synthetase-like amidotransferase/phosphosugar isomerase protein
LNIAELVAISNDVQTARLGQAASQLPAAAAEWLSPLTTIVPGQLLSLYLAHERGRSAR